MSWGVRVSLPPKRTSSIDRPRRWRALCSPMHQRMASTMFDLPHPLGPTMASTSWSKCSTVRSTNDLKPESSSFLIFIRGVSFSGGREGVASPPHSTHGQALPSHLYRRSLVQFKQEARRALFVGSKSELLASLERADSGRLLEKRRLVGEAVANLPPLARLGKFARVPRGYRSLSGTRLDRVPRQ